jgi:hypothetical protein
VPIQHKNKDGFLLFYRVQGQKANKEMAAFGGITVISIV